MFFTQTLEKKMLCAYTHTQITTINKSKKTLKMMWLEAKRENETARTSLAFL